MAQPRHLYFLGLYSAMSHEDRIKHLLVDVLVKLETLEIQMSTVQQTLAQSLIDLANIVTASSAAQAQADQEIITAISQIGTLISQGDTSAAAAQIETIVSQIAANTAKQQQDSANLATALQGVAAASPAPAPAPTPAPTPAAPAPSPTAQTPTAAFNWVQDATNPLQADFTDASVDTNTITAWAWTFGDGTGTSTEQNPTYVYAAAGTYVATLEITDATGSYTSLPVNVTVGAAAPAPTGN
jgi:PKD repeat protein